MRNGPIVAASTVPSDKLPPPFYVDERLRSLTNGLTDGRMTHRRTHRWPVRWMDKFRTNGRMDKLQTAGKLLDGRTDGICSFQAQIQGDITKTHGNLCSSNEELSFVGTAQHSPLFEQQTNIVKNFFVVRTARNSCLFEQKRILCRSKNKYTFVVRSILC